jgi:hypothetical protein
MVIATAGDLNHHDRVQFRKGLHPFCVTYLPTSANLAARST